jgi:hypothetical protein
MCSHLSWSRKQQPFVCARPPINRVLASNYRKISREALREPYIAPEILAAPPLNSQIKPPPPWDFGIWTT